MSADLGPKSLRMAEKVAFEVANRMKMLYAMKKLRTWPELEAACGIQVPDMFRNGPCNYDVISNQFFPYWTTTFKERLEKETQRLANREAAVKIPRLQDVTVENFGGVKLLEEQQIAVDRIWDKFYGSNKHQVVEVSPNLVKGILQDGGTGSGKTYIIAGILHRFFQQNRHQDGLPLCRVLLVTVKNALEQTRRVLEQAGLGQYLETYIFTTSYSQLTSRYGSIFLLNKYDSIHDKDITYWNPAMTPSLAIFDECHRLNLEDSKQTQAVRTLLKSPTRPKVLLLSATPYITVNHAKTIVLASDITFQGMRVTEENWKTFAFQMARDPSKPNKEAAKRLRAVLSNNIVSLPYVKWPHKAINDILLCDFKRPQDRILYDKAYADYLEKCNQLGKNTEFGPFQKAVAMGQFRKRVEPIRIPDIIERALKDYQQGKAPVIAMAFRASIQLGVDLLHQAGINRKEISVIWGGKRALNESLLLTKEEEQDITHRIALGEPITEHELRRLQESIDWDSDRIMSGDEDVEAQRERHERLRDYNLLGTQSPNARQIEIDRFQSGEAKFCLFTLPAGGVGLSLDQCRPELWPREVYITLTYSGVHVVQGAGRCVRRTTCSDTRQHFCLMKDTVEEYHVAPNIDSKIGCLAEATKGALELVDLSPAAIARSEANRQRIKLRSEDEVLKDSENPESQFHILSDKEDHESSNDQDQDE